ncbi:COX15/CtaA family protein [Phaeocystidibacter luteus]|uniref:Heme A synthase n=1 Tax=Phaeocystidibacter luteus TaxID=911197 RepID=A0A6N6RGP0_9FLAO|nr:COX15/CtaA family protein [Phaeocystidibacter luteus]KAB2810349.1 heme A synthase [Phaeocystidibacter luteus]
MMKWLRRLVRLELVLIFLVILAGSVVRMTGSGMGCPDWPKCFGYMIPPTEEAQVLWAPEKQYHEGQMIVHEEAMWSANADFTSGAEYNAANWTKYTKHDYAIFNSTHTWVEYINRLLGAASGIPMFLLFVLSLKYLKSKPLYTLLATAGLFLLGFEAWLGKEVVDGNLIPGQITYHMLGAFLIVIVLVIFLKRLNQNPRQSLPLSRWYMFAALLLMLIQVVLGTQVREQVDMLTKQFGEGASREGWIDQIDVLIYIHRSASLAVTGFIIYLWWVLRKNGKSRRYLNAALMMVLASTASGAILFYFDLPKFLQPVHLLLSAGIVATLTWGWVRRPKTA